MTDRSWETIEQRISYSCPGFDVVTDTVGLPGGEETEFDYLSEGESVVVLPFTPDGEVVVIEEWRQAVKRSNRAIPAGSLEPGEDPEAAVDRELREETGYEAETIEHLTTVEPANGFADAVFHYYVARDCTPTAEQELDVNETIDVDLASFGELVTAAGEGELRDGRTAFGVVYYALFESGRDVSGGSRPDERKS
ncbi:MAG: NUDIX hydrolase [Salinirussus sp.]